MANKEIFMKRGFTLSETLITLAIIGVVAAITLSSVINKYQKTYLQKRFAKSYNTLAVATQKAYADMGYMANCGYYHDGPSNFEDCAELNDKLASNLNVIKYCAPGQESRECTDHINSMDTVGRFSSFAGLNGGQIHTGRVYFLNDGMMYEEWRTCPFLLVDTNGKKGPNKWGYDVFVFWIAWQRFRCYEDFIEPGGIKCSERLKNVNH